MVLDMFERARKDGEDAAQVMRERDELRRRDAESHQWMLILQGELEKEKGLKLVI
jgi:DNA-binding PucR family transcriptional regulator